MGRFASTVEFYARYREPYSPEFFASVAQQIGLRGTETLLDVGCGPGLLAIGFAPYVGRCSGIDPEAAMIEAAKSAAAEAGVALTLTHGRLEEFSAERTIRCCDHWTGAALDRSHGCAAGVGANCFERRAHSDLPCLQRGNAGDAMDEAIRQDAPPLGLGDRRGAIPGEGVVRGIRL